MSADWGKYDICHVVFTPNLVVINITFMYNLC
jgi:hypothetical protein